MIRWFINFLYGSLPAEFVSKYDLEESMQRLSAATKRSAFSALTRQAAVGKVTTQSVSLQRVIPFVSNSYKPFFRGSFQRVGDQIQLVGSFSMHLGVKVFLSIWFGFCVLWTIFASVLSFAQYPHDKWLPLAGIVVFFFGIGFVQLGKWFARNDIAWLSRLIEETLSE